VLATGTELRRPGAELGPGEIYESNSLMLAAQLVQAGADAVVLEAVADDASALGDALERALEHDMVITSGGVSVGPHDLVRATLSRLGAEEVFWRVAVKPGKPVAFAVRGDALIFGLPGNPVSSLVGFELFVRPALRALSGAADPQPRFRQAPLAASVRRDDRREELVRARLVDGALEPITGQDSHMIARASLADALVRVPSGSGEVAAGTQVSYLSI
jgi:molybdopterin molybdotransferase